MARKSCVGCPFLPDKLGDYEEVPTHSRDEEDVINADPTSNAHVAAGKAISFLMKKEYEGFCTVEKASVYGAAVALPQIARSVGWSATMTGLSIRSYLFLVFNIIIQGFILTVMNEEASIMDPFAGKMHLCDFGASISSCPEGTNCRGPGGTTYTFPRLYDFPTWSTRLFVRDSLRALFPERESDILSAADPGEYGLEDYYCRLVCCLIFMLGVVDDLQGTLNLVSLLYHTPTRAETWIWYEVPDWMERQQAKKVRGWTELDLVRFKVAGMPLFWKVVNGLVVVIPKTYIWWVLVSTGFRFLMDTAGIMELVVNCMALAFVLNVDEMVFARLATMTAKHMMSNLEDLALFDTKAEEEETETEVLERYRREEFGPHRWKVVFLVFPKRLLVVAVLMAVFIFKYYYSNCQREEDGSWVSQPIYAPRSVSYNPLAFIHRLFLDASDVPTWSMPAGED